MVNPFKLVFAGDYADLRYNRGGYGHEFVVPALVKVGAYFPVILSAGSSTIKRIAFFNQSGYWSQYFPLDHAAIDLGLSSQVSQLVHHYSSSYDYHRWEVSNVSGGDFNDEFRVNNTGRITLYVSYERPDNVEESATFVIDVVNDPSKPLNGNNAIYSNGALHIPNIDVTVTDPFTGTSTVTYEADLQFVPGSSPMMFELKSATKK